MNRHTAVERCNMGGQIDKSNIVPRKDVLISQFFSWFVSRPGDLTAIFVIPLKPFRQIHGHAKTAFVLFNSYIIHTDDVSEAVKRNFTKLLLMSIPTSIFIPKCSSNFQRCNLLTDKCINLRNDVQKRTRSQNSTALCHIAKLRVQQPCRDIS